MKEKIIRWFNIVFPEPEPNREFVKYQKVEPFGWKDWAYFYIFVIIWTPLFIGGLLLGDMYAPNDLGIHNPQIDVLMGTVANKPQL